jgi:acetaldehyde dehydrogenase/alcohol dehydrogenase
MKTENQNGPALTSEGLQKTAARVREAQRLYADYTQEAVDRIFFAAARAAAKERIPLAKMAVE